MRSLLALILVLSVNFWKDSLVHGSGVSGDILQATYTAPERRQDLDGSDTWLFQKGDSPLPAIDQNVAALMAPNTAATNHFPSPNNDNKLLSETTTSETESTGLLIASNTDCRSSTDYGTLESHQQTAAQQSPTDERNARRRRRARREENSVVRVDDAPTYVCPLNPAPQPSPSTEQRLTAPEEVPKKKKKQTDPKSNENTRVVHPSGADLNWNSDIYSKGGYNPTCITKTNGLLPLGVCDSGDDEDRRNSIYDINGNLIDSSVFLDSIAFKLNHCRLGVY